MRMSPGREAEADRAIASLRQLLERRRGSALPLRELSALAELPSDWGITIDFSASQALGCALVIVRPRRHDVGHACPLSARELEVVALIADGRSNKEIAARLHIAVGTVKDHVHRMIEKTGLPNRTALALAFRNASLGPPDRARNPSLDRILTAHEPG